MLTIDVPEKIFLCEQRITQDKILEYCKASGDFNPIHFDADSAEALGLERPIAHGMYLIGLVYKSLIEFYGESRNSLGGFMKKKARVISLDSKFTLPVRVGETITMSIKELSKTGAHESSVETEICTHVFLYIKESDSLCCQVSARLWVEKQSLV